MSHKSKNLVLILPHSLSDLYALHLISITIIFLMIVPGLSPNVIVRSVSAQLPPAILHSNVSSSGTTPPLVATSNASTVTINTTNVIQGSNVTLLKSQEPMIKRAVVAAIGNAILITKGSVTGHTPVSVNAKVIDQLDNHRVSTTQGINFTKSVVALAVANAIEELTKNNNTTAMPRVAVDNQATCEGIGSPTSPVCNFIIDIHK